MLFWHISITWKLEKKMLTQLDLSHIPKSVNPKRIAENFAIFDFELTTNQMASIEKLNQNRRLGEDLSHIE